MAHELNDWVTIDHLVDRHSDKFTRGQILWALRHRDENGLNAHVTRLGRHLYINLPGFTTWFVENGREAI